MNTLFSGIENNNIFGSIINNFRASGPSDWIDILIIAVLVYMLMGMVRKTQAGQVAKGALVLVAILTLSEIFNLRTVRFVLNSLLQVGILALVVLFQPELRRALEQMGRTEQWVSQIIHQRGKMDEGVRGKWQAAILAICDAAEQLSDTHTGALIVLERGTNLSEIIRTGTPLHADVNSEMLGTIFYEGTPLHDGAVVIRDGELVAAGCVLPLSNNLQIGKDMGTRHRAALGMSENSDAICVVVSEETGIISMTREGVLMRRLDRQKLYSMLETELIPREETPAQKTTLLPWRKKNEKA